MPFDKIVARCSGIAGWPWVIQARYEEGELTLQLGNAEEIENGKSNGALGEIFIRCNNVLYIRSADEDPDLGGS